MKAVIGELKEGIGAFRSLALEMVSIIRHRITKVNIFRNRAQTHDN